MMVGITKRRRTDNTQEVLATYVQGEPELNRSKRFGHEYIISLETTMGGLMDTKEIIAEMFWKDYQAMSDGEAENWSQVQILSDFLIWIDQRKTGCNLIDLRLVKDPMAQDAVDQLRW
jgi:hypothetical protein